MFDRSNFDTVVDLAGNELYLRPRVNRGAFYSYGAWKGADDEDGVELASGWVDATDFDAPFDPVAVRKDSNGTVFLRGVLMCQPDSLPTPTGSNYPLLTLPEGYRPETNQIVVSVSSALSSDGGGYSVMIPTFFTVQSDGDVLVSFGDKFFDFDSGSYGVVALSEVLDNIDSVGVNLYGQFPTASVPVHEYDI